MPNVTLSDEEARRRGTQKSCSRRRPATFDVRVLIEIKDSDRVAHPMPSSPTWSDPSVRGLSRMHTPKTPSALARAG